jgi:nucleotide-binding universal stress UspA family protein
MTNNILALIDFSSICESIVKRAGELAKFYDAKCWLIHVAAPDPDFVGYDVGPQYIRDSIADELKEEHTKLEAFKDQLSKEGVNCEMLLIQGQINPTILGEIKKLNIDMVVLGSHGHTKLYDLLAGSVCEYVLRHATVPLLIIPSGGKQFTEDDQKKSHK